MSEDPIQFEMQGKVAVVRLDDGKANALSYAVLSGLEAALDRAQKEEAAALVLVGREGRFSAGFDLSVMREGPASAMKLALTGADLAIRLYSFPIPVVYAVTGHALAMGAVLLCAADERIGSDGPFKIGLNEVAIGMTLPDFAIQFATERLSRRHLSRATANGEIYTPSAAVDAGYLDRVVAPEDCVATAIERATVLGETLNGRAHAGTKLALRAAALDRLRQGVADGREQLGTGGA